MGITRNARTLAQVKCRWNKKLDALGLPRIPRATTDLPRTFEAYLEIFQKAQENEQKQIIDNAEGAGMDAVNNSAINSQYMDTLASMLCNKISVLADTQAIQSQKILNKLEGIESRLDALELLAKTRNVDFDEQFDKIRTALAEIRPPEAACAAQVAGDIQAPSPPQAAPQAPLTPIERRRAEPLEPTDHRRESLPDWVVQDLSYDFSPDAIKNMFERFKQYYYENDRILPDYNGVKIKLRQWLERAAENGEAVMSNRALAELENARIERARAENTRRNEEYQRHRAEVSTGAVSQQVNAGLDNILAKLVKRDEEN